MDKIFFLSGLPRSGSTLLGSLLSQNPEMYVSPTSPLLDLFCKIDETLNFLKETYTFDLEEVGKNIFQNLPHSFYKNVDKKYIIDKHRGHPKNVIPLKKFVTESPKIICLIRPIAEIISSYIKLINQSDKNNFLDEHLNKINLKKSTENRASLLWNEYISDPYESTKIGLENYRDCILIVKYDDLVFNPEKTMFQIYDFLEIMPFEKHNFNNIKNYCTEKDDKWGIENLHTIRENLSKTSTDPNLILGNYLTKFYNEFSL
jgi:sulfotransferase